MDFLRNLPTLTEEEFEQRFGSGPYHLLGTGAWGKVYKVSDNHHRKDVALKLVTIYSFLGFLADNGKLKELSIKNEVKEFYINNMLDHPNLVKYYDIFLYNKTYNERYVGITMQLIEGISLSSGYVFRNIHFIGDQFWAFAVQLTSVMNYLHSKKVHHNDAHMGNILVTDDLKIYLTDFGWACLEGGDDLTKCREDLRSPVGKEDSTYVGKILYDIYYGLEGFGSGGKKEVLNRKFSEGFEEPASYIGKSNKTMSKEIGNFIDSILNGESDMKKAFSEAKSYINKYKVEFEWKGSKKYLL